MVKKEDWLNLWSRGESFNDQLMVMLHQWTRRAEDMKKELEHQLEESVRMREAEEKKKKLGDPRSL